MHTHIFIYLFVYLLIYLFIYLFIHLDTPLSGKTTHFLVLNKPTVLGIARSWSTECWRWWALLRDELREGMVFRTCGGSGVTLEDKIGPQDEYDMSLISHQYVIYGCLSRYWIWLVLFICVKKMEMHQAHAWNCLKYLSRPRPPSQFQ